MAPETLRETYDKNKQHLVDIVKFIEGLKPTELVISRLGKWCSDKLYTAFYEERRK